MCTVATLKMVLTESALTDLNRVRLATVTSGGLVMPVEVTRPSLCSVPSRVQPLGRGEEGPGPVCQQRAARHGRMFAHRLRLTSRRTVNSIGALGVSVTDYTYDDCQLALAEGQLRLPADTCLLEFARLVRGLGLKPETLEKDLDKYSDRAQTQGGRRVGLPEFAEYLGVPVSDTLRDLFSLFDESGDGTMDPREYVVALSVVCRPSRTLDTIQLAFRMYGSQDGCVDEGALSSILKTALGVAELTVTDLFRAIDEEETGRITFADFRRFAEAFPDFAEDYLYPDQTRPESCPQTPPAPAPNGFCADFSPENSGVGRKPFRKKLD
uniref:Lysophosphatidylcholine acyltransferase 1 n=1 Tax=Felis catus TaxID=9685 RepID=A0ABI7VQ80_FELCA